MSFGSGVLVEAGDVLSDRAIEQLDVLRQIADVAAERFGVPMFERGMVEPHRAAKRGPRADDGAYQRRFARCTRSDDPQAGTRFKCERNVLDQRLLLTGSGDCKTLDGKHCRGRGSAIG